MSLIEDTLREIHGDDEEQLGIILSQEPRIIVEASAGCGKTKTLISKIAYLLGNRSIPVHKKVLILTFGVNAAYKIKKEVFEKIPLLVKDVENLEDKIVVTNFHGLSRKILSNYGYRYNDNLLKLNTFSVVDDSKTEDLTQLDIGILEDEAHFLSNYSLNIKGNNRDYMNQHFGRYISLIKNKFLQNMYITHNAILMLTLDLFHKNREILQFYQKLFPYIIIDEFQDTGILSWALLKLIIAENTSLLFMGDPLQRIYGFIGAIPDLMRDASQIYSMKKLKITTNYRFRDNYNMLLLDKNIRENSRGSFGLITQDAIIPFNLYSTQHEEAEYIRAKLAYLLEHDKKSKIVILAQSRTNNLNYILEYIANNSICYFNGLFSEESYSYKRFHQDVLKIFIQCYTYSKTKTIHKSLLHKVYTQVCALYEGRTTDEISSLIKLLKVFFDNIFINRIFISNEEKYLLIVDVLSNNSLKQSMELLDEQIIVTTVHGAKGLEWDYVLIPDMERSSFPNYPSLCRLCKEISNQDGCRGCLIKIDPSNKSFYDKYLESLSVFYVAVTRAKKQVFFSASLETLNAPRYPRTKYSCLLSLPGIKIQTDEEF